MAVEDIRNGVAAAKGKCNAGIAALQQAQQALEEAMNLFGTATAGSSQSEVTQTQGMLQEAVQSINSNQNTIQAATQSADSYAQRL